MDPDTSEQVDIVIIGENSCQRQKDKLNFIIIDWKTDDNERLFDDDHDDNDGGIVRDQLSVSHLKVKLNPEEEAQPQSPQKSIENVKAT
ncbi:unnamed protein product [Orchesella dallaii]|uniref:Uncharacterized protein n=1 Tax=Orchesella dallaii TaxID=48710 RepID=A0ABP1PPZ0_9HEXA